MTPMAEPLVFATVPDGGQDDLDAAVGELLERCHAIAKERNLDFEYEVLHRQDGVEADSRLSQILTEAAQVTDNNAERLVIGAGHDALIMARRMPISMLFLRSPGGISHHPDEAVIPADVDAALEVLGASIKRLADLEAPEDWSSAWDLAWPEEPSATSATSATLDLDG